MKGLAWGNNHIFPSSVELMITCTGSVKKLYLSFLSATWLPLTLGFALCMYFSILSIIELKRGVHVTSTNISMPCISWNMIASESGTC